MRLTYFAWLCLVLACGDSGDGSSTKKDMGGVPADGGGDAEVADGPETDGSLPACSDGEDNDADGATDYPDDSGCADALDDDEAGPGKTECNDGIDNDDDDLIDFGSDPGCSSEADDDETDFDPTGCGGVGTFEIAVGAAISDTLVAGASAFESQCGGFGAEIIYHITITDPGTYVFSTVDPATTLDSVVYARSDCDDETTEVGCNDQGSDPPASTLIVELLVGEYFIFVDSWSGAGAGDYVLHVGALLDIGEICDPSMPDLCAPGLLCRTDVDYGTDFVCLAPVCSDGTDDDADGLVDFPNEPGCESPDDDDESDGCPDTDCPECGDGVDNDGDGDGDFPLDFGCASAADITELDECAPDIFATELTDGTESGSLGSSSAFSSCGWGTGMTSEDIYSFQITVPVNVVHIDTNPSPSADVVLYVRTDCSDAGSEIVCFDNPSANSASIDLEDLELGSYYIFVDANTGSGSYDLTVTGEISPGGACDPSSTLFVCPAGTECGAVSGTCDGTLCNDTIDNDSDGYIDYPDEPGCETLNDQTEDDPVPPPTCFNGTDDDADGFSDYPFDIGCIAAGDGDETDECIPGVIATSLETSPVTGSVESETPSDFSGSCGWGTFNTNEDIYAVRVSVPISLLHVSATDTSFGDLVLYVRTECGDAATELTCNESPSNSSATIDIDDPALGVYYIFVDGNTSGTYELVVEGEIAAGGLCDPLDEIFTCADNGYACFESVPGNNDWACRIGACDDGIDNDGDGAIDFPADFGCTGPLENTEADRACHDAVDNDFDATSDYPNDPGCSDPTDLSEADPAIMPACANGTDDDGDGANNYPDDVGCYAASDPNETDPCSEGESVPDLTATRSYSGTTTGMTDSHDPPECAAGSTAPDAVFLYRVISPRSVSVTVEPTGGWDSIVWVRAADCLAGTEVACNDDALGGTGSKVSFTDSVAGEYFIFVSGGGTESGDFELTIVDNECSNSIDDDGDGLVDFPEEPGCSSATGDGDETDSCPGVGEGCPECADGVDNDDDGDTDTDDNACGAASDDNEACVLFGSDDYGYIGCEEDFSGLDIESVCPNPTDGSTLFLSDDDSEIVPIGFTFDWYGDSVSDVTVVSNGKIGFPATSLAYVGDACLPDPFETNVVFTWWDDLYPPSGGSVTYDTVDVGGSDAFVVRWNLPHISLGTGDLIDVRAVLHENGDIDVCYVDTSFGDPFYNEGGSATTGIEGPTTADNIEYSCSSPVLYEGLVLHYVHP